MEGDRSERINRLLHDAEQAESGAWFAWRMARSVAGDGPKAVARRNEHMEHAAGMDAKAKRLRAEALELDPERTDPAWREDEAWRHRTGSEK